MQSLRFSGAEQFDESLWEDRDVVELSDSLFAVPVYKRDILENQAVSHIQLPNNLIVVSWDDFTFDAILLRDVDDETVISWLLVEKVEDGGYRVILDRGNVFAILKDVLDFLKERRI